MDSADIALQHPDAASDREMLARLEAQKAELERRLGQE